MIAGFRMAYCGHQKHTTCKKGRLPAHVGSIVRMYLHGWTMSREHDTHNIDSFYGMRLLKVPFHEEPWHGTGDNRGQQYVYIVRATLKFANYRQVLYLKEIKSAHTKLYEMFVYSDLCWTRKYVPRIFQLKSPTKHRPVGHYNRRLNTYIDRLYPTK